MQKKAARTDAMRIVSEIANGNTAGTGMPEKRYC
jgi:hypothetical protein